MEDIDGGLHPAEDGQSLDEDEDEVRGIFLELILRGFLRVLRFPALCHRLMISANEIKLRINSISTLI